MPWRLPCPFSVFPFLTLLNGFIVHLEAKRKVLTIRGTLPIGSCRVRRMRSPFVRLMGKGQRFVIDDGRNGAQEDAHI